jgi:hypothetical protein
MTEKQLKQYAQRVLKESLNLDAPQKKIILLESTDNETEVEYLLFRISGIESIEYCIRKKPLTRLDAFSIINKMDNEELFINYLL